MENCSCQRKLNRQNQQHRVTTVGALMQSIRCCFIASVSTANIICEGGAASRGRAGIFRDPEPAYEPVQTQHAKYERMSEVTYLHGATK